MSTTLVIGARASRLAALALATLGTLTIPVVAKAASVVGGPINRTEVLSRAQFWYTRHVPYSWTKTYPDPQGRPYRTDCSGYVSMALHLPGKGLAAPSTVTITRYLQNHGTYSAPKWLDLKPADVVGILGKNTGGDAGHVVLFTGWKTRGKVFYTLEERGTAYGTVKYYRRINFGLNSGTKTARPYKYKKILG